ncbi:MAG TPA: ATP-binding protein [Kofleriaceae bacterium]|nr:ATP-binding protein [Kofleriaceae bacterium]
MKRLRHEDAVFVLALAAAAVPSVIALSILWTGDFDAKTRWTFTLFILGGAVGCAAAVRARVARPLQSLANLIAAVREGDYSVRGHRLGRSDDALDEAISEVNALSRTLRAQRHADIEATTALSAVIAGLDAAIFVFDPSGGVRLANRAAERLLGRAAVQLVGRSADELGVGGLVLGEPRRTEQLAQVAGATWDVRRTEIRLEGRPHMMIVLTDVQRALREEERQAWQRLVRVLGHEINNSLGPIQSIAGTLRATRGSADWPDDVERGLAVIERRSEALGRFMNSYARLARLPPPRLGKVDVRAWAARAVELESRLAVALSPGPEVAVLGDGDQLDQLLINLISNAVEAAVEQGGGAGVRVSWDADDASVSIVVEDDGPGLPPSANLFVPFFTTKPSGSGIGLVLSRQIAEAHAGRLILANRSDAHGCRATIILPRRA